LRFNSELARDENALLRIAASSFYLGFGFRDVFFYHFNGVLRLLVTVDMFSGVLETGLGIITSDLIAQVGYKMAQNEGRCNT
jgi:hypothetical protein